MKHDLKIQKQYLDNLLSGKKRAETRYNDRDYQVGDTLNFAKSWETPVEFTITHVHSGMGLTNGWVVLSLGR